ERVSWCEPEWASDRERDVFGMKAIPDAKVLIRLGTLGQIAELGERDAGDQELSRPGPTTSIAAPVGQSDLTTVVKALQTVSGEIVLERLLVRLAITAVEQGGADRGLVILVSGDGPQAAAEALVNGGRGTLPLPQPPAGSP